MLNRFRAHWMRSCIATLLLATQACYTFIPVAAGTTPHVGELAKISLTAEGTTELARYLGPNVVETEGVVAANGEDGRITLAVEMVKQSNGLRQPWTGEGVVEIPAMYQQGVQERVFQKRRSIVAGSLLALGLMSLAVIALRSGVGGEGGFEPPPPTP